MDQAETRFFRDDYISIARRINSPPILLHLGSTEFIADGVTLTPAIDDGKSILGLSDIYPQVKGRILAQEGKKTKGSQAMDLPLKLYCLYSLDIRFAKSVADYK